MPNPGVQNPGAVSGSSRQRSPGDAGRELPGARRDARRGGLPEAAAARASATGHQQQQQQLAAAGDAARELPGARRDARCGGLPEAAAARASAGGRQSQQQQQLQSAGGGDAGQERPGGGLSVRSGGQSQQQQQLQSAGSPTPNPGISNIYISISIPKISISVFRCAETRGCPTHPWLQTQP